MNEKNNDNVKVEGPEVERKENEGECSTRKRTKEDRSKKKDDKRPSEQYSKILGHISSPEDKLDVMCKKYSQSVDENRRLSLALKHSEKKVELLLREREQLQIERSKSIMTRKRLENLCRELQKQNKIVKNESLQRVKEQEEIRKDLSEKFQGGLAQITTLMNQNIEKNAKMYEENLEINKKFKAVYEQVEQKEQQLLKVHQQMKLDLQVADAKLAKVKMEATAEKETLLKEKQQLLVKMTEYQTQIRELQANEVGLRSEISMYTDKYDEFQNALNRSNKIYGEFNVEMEKMTKKLYALEKETSLWKQRWANSHDALLAMAADKQSRDGEIAMLSKKLTLLQDLCKMFQCERTKLLAQLKTQSNKVPSPEPASTAVLESQEVVKYMKQMDELPNLENTFEQLQASLADVSEAMRRSSDASSKAVPTNCTTEVEQKSETTETELDEKNAERLQTALENATGDSSEDCNSSKLNGDTVKPVFYEDFVTLDYAEETREAKEQLDSQESPNINKKKSAITMITNEELDETSSQSVESSKREEGNEDSHKLTDLSKTEETNEETNKEKPPKDTETNNKSDRVEEQTYKNVKKTNDETNIEKPNEVPEQDLMKFSRLEFDTLDVQDIILEATDLAQEKEIDLLPGGTNNHLNEQLECQAVKNTNENNKTHESATSKVMEGDENIEVACTNSTVCNETLSEDRAQNNQAEIVESNIESVDEISDKSATESISMLVKNTSEASKTADTTATEDTTFMVQEKSEVVAETADEVVQNSSELADNTVDIRLTKDVLSVDEENTSKLATEATCIPAIESVTSPKEAPTKTLLTSENDCAEEKLSKPAPIKKRRRK